ncbi:MAG: helicase-related protein [Phycisphaerae bacterium]|nr:helicase-related protein [Phycisphaerae bacterium]
MNWQEMFLDDLTNQRNATAVAEPKPIGLLENIERGGWSGFADRATFGVKPMVEAGMLYNATKRFQLDDYPRTDEGWQQRLDDKDRIVEYLEEQAEISQRGLTIPAKVGTVVFDMLPFMAEFLATGGLSALGKAAAKKSILNLAGKYAASRTARIAADIGSTMVSAGIRSSLTPQHIAEKYFENQLPQMQLDESNSVVLGDTENTPATAIYKAIGDWYIELLSEESGAGIARMAKGIMPKGINSSASKLINSLRRKWIKAMPGRDSVAFAKRMAQKAGFHGILEEMGEERLGDLLRATFNIEDFGQKDGNTFDRLVAAIPDGEQLLVESLAFSVPSAGRMALAAGHELAVQPKKEQQSKEYLLTPEGAQLFARLNPQAASTIAQKENPSRKDMLATGISRWSGDERNKFSQLLRQFQQPATQQPAQDLPQPPIEEAETLEDQPEEQPPQVPQIQTDAEKYYYFDADEEKFVEAEDAERIVFPGLDGADFFVAQRKGKWSVYEAISGLQVSVKNKTKKGAVQEAIEKLGKHTADDIQKYIDAAVEKHGHSPKYPDYVKTQTEKPQPKPTMAKYGDTYTGDAFRAETGFTHDKNATAADVVRYEQDELGNDLGVSDEQLSELENYSADQIKWVTRTEEAANRYGTPQQVQAEGGKVIAEIGSDGVLVLMQKTESKEQPQEPQTTTPKFNEGQKVKYTDRTGKIVTGIVTGTTKIGEKDYVNVTADPEHETVVGGGIPIGRKETIPIGKVTAIEETERKAESKPQPKKKSITENLSAQKQQRLEELKKRFKDKINNQLNMGFDPEMLTITAEMAALYIEAGARTFAKFAKAVVADVGGQFKPYLKSAYLAARNMPGMEDFRSEMDGADFVDKLTDREISNILETDSKETDNAGLEHRGLEETGFERQGQQSDSGGSMASSGTVAAETGEASIEGQADELSSGRSRQGTGAEDDTQSAEHAGGRSRGDDTQTGGSTGKSQVPGHGSGGSDSKREGDEAAGTVQQPSVEGQGRLRPDAVNHRIASDDVIAPKGAITQIKANIEAIKLLKQLEAENRNATPEEQKILAQYSGWGNLSQVFHEGYGRAMIAFENNEDEYEWKWSRDENWEKKWGKYYKQLKELLTEQEFNAAAASTLNAHYTERGVIESMWDMAEKLGFKGGTILEPGAGIGHFFGLMPQQLSENSKLIGVELDSISGRILSKLYPKAKTFNKGFEDVNIPPNSVNLVISNYPFAQQGPADAKKRYGIDLNLHNYFFARSIDALRPGGVLIAITTHHTMDSAMNQRKLLASKAELIAAIRLPNTAFKENAGTEVTTDIIILRKPLTEQIGGSDWTRVGEIETEESKVASINEYFISNPEMMLGKPSMEGSLYGAEEEFTLKPLDMPLSQSIDEAIEKLPENIISADTADVDFEDIGSADGYKDNSLIFQNGKLVVLQEGKFVPVSEVSDKLKSASAKKQAIRYIKLRDTYQQHLQTMLREDATDDDIIQSQKKLNEAYDEYIAKYGFVTNDSTKKFSFDPGYYLVASLEEVHTSKDLVTGKDVKQVDKAAVFTKRTIEPVRPPANAESLADALKISLCYRGKVDIRYLSELINKSVEDVQKQLLDSGIAYDNPATGLWETSERYLSGNVREKLRVAEVAANSDKHFEKHVKALAEIQPKTVGIKDIHFRLGAAWIPQDIIQDFARDILSSPYAKVKYVASLDEWTVVSDSFVHNARNTETYGTKRFYGHELLEKALNMRQIRVTDKIKDGDSTRTVFNQKETLAAQMVVEKLQQEFSKWIEKHDEYSLKLQEEYNEHFNFYVTPKYNGQHLELPGSSNVFQLRDYQKNVVWRMLQDRCGMIAHCVGAGKTLAMAATAMEMRRLGLAKKPLIVVQNSTLGQFPSQFRAMYPTANILVATPEDLEAKKRRVFMGRIASGDYDSIIMAQSSFDLIPNDPARQEEYMHQQMAELKDSLYDVAAAEGDKSPSVKAIQRRLKSLEKKLTKLRDKLSARQDDVINFEQLGIDALFIDEAHAYKKPPFTTKLSNIKGIDNNPSQKASDLFLKCRHIQEKTNGKGVILATGTPVTNTLGEAWHMLNLSTPHLLDEFSIDTFDRFVAAFAQILPTIEMNAGQRWVQRQVLSKFANGPELSRLIQSAWDVLTRDDLAAELEKLGKKLPQLRGGKTESVSVPLSPAVKSFNGFLKKVYERYENLQGKEKQQYNWVPVVTYNAAKAAALDIRLVYPKAKDDPGSKVNTLVKNALDIYNKTTDSKGTQLLFCDSFNHVNMSNLSRFVSGEAVEIDVEEDSEAPIMEDMFLYKDIKRKLIGQGVPEHEIAVVRDYKSTAQREALFDRVNAGDVRILIGSTSAMGVGVNVQKKLYAIHHLDTPWLPADLEQRQGRLLRYGNENEFVEELAYGMENTLDAAIYAKIVRKAKFIWQVLSGQVSAREFEDPAGALIISAEEQMASLSGDPRIFEKIELENSLRQMRMEKDAHADAVARSRDTKFKSQKEIMELVDKTIPAKKERLEKLEKLIDGTNWKLNGESIDKKDLTAKLSDIIDKRSEKILNDTKKSIIEPYNPRGLAALTDNNIVLKKNINGLDILMVMGVYKVAAHDVKGGLTFDWQVEVNTKISLDGTGLYHSDAKTGTGVVMAIANMPKQAARELETSENRVQYLTNNIKELEAIIEKPYEKQSQLQAAEQKLSEINRDLVGEDKDKPHNIKKPKLAPDAAKQTTSDNEANTEDGKKLIKKINDGSTKGPRTIVEFVNDLVSAKMLVGKSQTSNRNPAHYTAFGHIIRSRSGIWQLNFHEAGHALSEMLSDSKKNWNSDIKDDLVAFAKRSGSMASAKTAEEGFAELIRCYITNRDEIPGKLVKGFEMALGELSPDILDGLNDARKAYSLHRSKPILDQLKAIQQDKPAGKSLSESLTDLAYNGLYALLGGSAVIHRLIRSTFNKMAGNGKFSALDITGAVGLVKSKLDSAYKARLKLARKFRDEITNTKADIMSAYQTMIHLRQEVQRALYGIRKGREGIRVYSTGNGFEELVEQELELLKTAGFEIPAESPKHGHWLYLSDKSISRIKHEVGLENWEAFCLYGQYRAALERYYKKRHEYPGMFDGLNPEVLQDWLREQNAQNPQWDNHFKQIQKYMDQLLLVSVFSGEHTVAEAVKIKLAWEDYWPLPRQIEDKRIKNSGGGIDPDSGIRAAFGSSLPFRTLDEAIETRTRMAFEAYYTNRLMWSMIEFGKKINNMKELPFEVRKNAARIMLPLRLDTKLAATMSDLEQAQIIADYLNKQKAQELGMTIQMLKLTAQDYDPDDIEITHPGRKLWRSARPRAIRVVSVFRNGKRRYYQVTDPLLFEMLSRGNNPSKYFGWISKAMTGMIAPWRRALTQNIGFALANSISRDPANAGFMGKDGAKSLIPYYYAGCGLINRLKGNNINADAVSQSELLSKALDHTTKDAHQGIVGSFKEMLKEGIVLGDYRELNLSDKAATLPGQIMSTLMKPIDIFNWTSGGRWLSQTGEELPREGAYISAIKRGQSPEAAQVDYDYITGDFGGKPGSANIASMVKAAGFLNPALRIMWGQFTRVSDPDPAARAFNMAAKVPALMMWGAIGAAINYLIIRAINPDDDDRESVLEQMRERPDDNRLAYMAIAGKIRLPFDYGLIGAACSYGWNSVEQWLLDDPISAEKKAQVLLARARELPGITDIINPYIKTGAELWLNHSFFYDDDIVPVWMEAAYPYNPEMKTWPNMPEIYNKIGRGLKVSPIKVRYAVQNIFTRQMDDAVKVAEKIAGKEPFNEAADLPVVGRLIDRKSTGWQSQSVKSLSDLDQQYDSLKAQLKDMEKRGQTKDYRQLQREIAKLQPLHNAMRQIEKLWKQVKTESARPNPDKGRIDRLKQEMTRRAKMFLKRNQKAA